MIDYIIEDCEQFSQKDKDEMFNLIAAHKKTGKEHGAKLCEKDVKKNEADNKIILSNHCVGSKCAIAPKKFAKTICPKDTTEIGTFHTHPKAGYWPSPNDIISMLDKGKKLSCIGTDLYSDEEKYKFHRTIDCHEIKNRQLKKLGKELRNARDDKRNKIIGSIVDILNKYPDYYIYELLNTKCNMQQSNNPKRYIWNEKTKRYVETFY